MHAHPRSCSSTHSNRFSDLVEIANDLIAHVIESNNYTTFCLFAPARIEMMEIPNGKKRKRFVEGEREDD